MHRELRSPRRAMRRRGAGVLIQDGHPLRHQSIRGNGWISQVPAETLAAAPMLLRPRKNRAELALSLRPVRPRVRERPWLLQLDFRGSIAWLDDLLSTLRTGRLPRRHARLASGCAVTLCRVGLAPTGSPMKGFSYVSESHIILLSRACLAQSRFLPPPSRIRCKC